MPPDSLPSIPEAWRLLGLPGEPPTRDGQLFCSPFRPDRRPKCYLRDNLTSFVDWAAGIEGTGTVGFVALALGFSHDATQRNAEDRNAIDQWFAGKGRLNMDARYHRNFGATLSSHFPNGHGTPRPKNMAYLDFRLKPEETERLERATQRLAALRKLPLSGVRMAVQRGLVIFGYNRPPTKENPSWGIRPFWGLYDETAQVLSVRRMDGLPWPAFGAFSEHKAKTPRGWTPGWWGISRLRDHHEYVIVCEGSPDYLASHCLLSEGVYPPESTAVVSAYSAHMRLDPAQVEQFRGRTIIVAPQRDEPFLAAAAAWKVSLRSVCESFSVLPLVAGAHDLNDDLTIRMLEGAACPTA